MLLPVSDLAFHQSLGSLVTRIDSDQFWPALATFLRKVGPFDSWVALIYQNGHPPIVLYEGDSDGTEDALFIKYVNSLYVLDPFYQFSLSQITPGLYRIDDVAPEHFRETEYFRRYFVHNVVADEVQFLIPLRDHGVMSLSLGGQTRFADSTIGTFCLFTPWLLPLMRLATYADCNGALRTARTATNRADLVNLEDWLRTNASSPLTDREIQTTMLILKGHSAKAIAHKMGISPETVKIHKRNLYRKMGVSSQAGIFAQFINMAG